jgi:NTE family protein
LRQTLRVMNVIDNQVRSLRKRQLIDGYQAGIRDGSYWGIRSNTGDYRLADPLPCPPDKTRELAAVATRLSGIPEQLQQRLINWGYAICDTAMRKWVTPAAAAGSFPYPGGVG